jgi:hypothetical protein
VATKSVFPHRPLGLKEADVIVMQASCDASMTFFPFEDLRTGGKMSMFKKLISAAQDVIKDAWPFRNNLNGNNLNGAVPLTTAQLTTMFEPWAIDFWLHMFTDGTVPGVFSATESACGPDGNAACTPNDVIIWNWPFYVQRVRDFLHKNGKLPKGCGLIDFVMGGRCAVSMKQLGVLMDADLNMVLSIKRCPGSHMPSFTLMCEGKDCRDAMSTDKMMMPCTKSADCGSALLTCKALPIEEPKDWSRCNHEGNFDCHYEREPTCWSGANGMYSDFANAFHMATGHADYVNKAIKYAKSASGDATKFGKVCIAKIPDPEKIKNWMKDMEKTIKDNNVMSMMKPAVIGNENDNTGNPEDNDKHTKEKVKDKQKGTDGSTDGHGLTYALIGVGVAGAAVLVYCYLQSQKKKALDSTYNLSSY